MGVRLLAWSVGSGGVRRQVLRCGVVCGCTWSIGRWRGKVVCVDGETRRERSTLLCFGSESTGLAIV